MRVKLTKNWSPTVGTIQLTRDEIEQQATTDFSHYGALYIKKYGKQIASPFDVDNFVEELWGATISYQDIQQPDTGDEILGYLDPVNNQIIVDADRCKYPARITFTVAHEAGHLSLHAFTMRRGTGKLLGWSNDPLPKQKSRLPKHEDKTGRLEWQANHYAASLLAPKRKVFSVLTDLGLIIANTMGKPVDLAVHAAKLQEQLALSRQALEIRLAELRVPVTNKKYD